MSELKKFDGWLEDGGPAAVVIREPLEPVEGRDGVFFPATYAPAEDKTLFRGGYNIDVFPDESAIGPVIQGMLKDGRIRPTIDLFPTSPNVCLVDSVGSQANRIEPLFAKPAYADLVPQIAVTAGDRTISLLEAGHRAADAVVRCSELKAELQAGFRALLRGDADPLAKLAPTSLVFGVWDSRDTQAKSPRLVSSTIRAFNVRKLMRSAQFVPAVDYINAGALTDPETVTDGKEKKKLEDGYSEWGLAHVPATGTHGGVYLSETGSVRRDATLSLAALRRLAALEANGTLSADRTAALRRYILGVALVALTAPQDSYLRQGCQLVPADEGRNRRFEVVQATGKREPLELSHEDARRYAEAAARGYKVADRREVAFDKRLVERDIKGEAAVSEAVAAPTRRGARTNRTNPS